MNEIDNEPGGCDNNCPDEVPISILGEPAHFQPSTFHNPSNGKEPDATAVSDEVEDDLSKLGVSMRDQGTLEGEVLEKIEEEERRRVIAALQSKIELLADEVAELTKKKLNVEEKLKCLYSTSAVSGGNVQKRKIQSVLDEQEKLNRDLKRAEKQKSDLLFKVSLHDPSFCEKFKQDCEAKALLAEKTSSGNAIKEDQIRLGELTAFGTALESSSHNDSQTARDYLNSFPQSTAVDKQTAKKRTIPQTKTKTKRKRVLTADSDDESDAYVPDEEEAESNSDSGNPDEPIESISDGDESYETDEELGWQPKKRRKIIDDGERDYYIQRLAEWERTQTKEDKESEGRYEKLKDGLKIPHSIWSKLYNYQKVGVQWMYELDKQKCGGILGDEMGLGKTVQVIGFLASMSYTSVERKRGLGPSIIVCPATVMHQWVQEFHKWWPPFRVGILHSSGSHTGSKRGLIRELNRCNGILVMSYQAVVTYIQEISSYPWHYLILDEGHKIRNPDAKVTLSVKQIATPHRLILSGSPLQNNLKELWSLFDFIFPGKLGTLPIFMQHFSEPITQGGYSNASQLQVTKAYKCASVLRDTINPYLLRRMKSDVKSHINLPEKNEQVLFCKLTDEQRSLYRGYLDSVETKNILNGRMKVFVGLIALRKICNHPDLFMRDQEDEREFGYYKKSGKMIVVHSLLKIWHKQEHRVLLFTQSKQMMKLLERYVLNQGYTYLKMDGTTSVKARHSLIDKYNNDTSIFVFLLTTKVGGLGVNLTGANRIVIFDPDWNPSTDTQARERAWRIGQRKQVTIYRLMTTGTIEEKIYHRQIFKQFLVNRVLKDPRQRRFFKSNDLYELFTLNETEDDKTETSAIFAGTGSDIRVKRKAIQARDSSQSRRSIPSKDEGRRLNGAQEDHTPRGSRDATSRKLAFNSGQTPSPSRLSGSSSHKSKSSANNEDEQSLLELNGLGGSSERAKDAKTSHQTSESALSEQRREELREKAKRISQLFSSQGSSTPPSGSYKIPKETPNSQLRVGQSSSPKANQVNGSESSREQYDRKSSDSERQNRKEKHKKKKDKKFEGERVPHLVKVRQYKRPAAASDEGDEAANDNEDERKRNSMNQDNYVLTKLFAKSGVHSALRHDMIVDEDTPDYAIIESEAIQVARDAAAALKQSRRECQSAETGVPNWTGNNGTTRRFGKKKKGPGGHGGGAESSTATPKLSSDLIISKMKSRNSLVASVDRSGEEDDLFRPDVARVEVAPANMDLLNDIRAFVAFQADEPGRATTQELVDKFKDQLPPQKNPLFKALLEQICHFSKGSSSGGKSSPGVWTLKQEFA